MGKKNTISDQTPHYVPIDEAARENELRALAYDLVAQRLRDGTASSAETTYFLKQDRERDRLKIKLLEDQSALMQAKIKNLESQTLSEESLQRAIEAFTSYRPTDD